MYREIDEEENNYKEALKEKPEKIKHLKFLIQHSIDTASNTKIHYRDLKFKDKNVDEMYQKVMSGEIVENEKSYVEALGKVTECQKIIDRGIRTPEQILEWYVDKIVTRRSPF